MKYNNSTQHFTIEQKAAYDEFMKTMTEVKPDNHDALSVRLSKLSDDVNDSRVLIMKTIKELKDVLNRIEVGLKAPQSTHIQPETYFPDPHVVNPLTTLQQIYYDYIKETETLNNDRGITCVTVAAHFKCPRSWAYGVMYTLHNKGYLTRQFVNGTKRNSLYYIKK